MATLYAIINPGGRTGNGSITITKPAGLSNGDHVTILTQSTSSDAVVTLPGFTQIEQLPRAGGTEYFNQVTEWQRTIDGTEGASWTASINSTIDFIGCYLGIAGYAVKDTTGVEARDLATNGDWNNTGNGGPPAITTLGTDRLVIAVLLTQDLAAPNGTLDANYGASSGPVNSYSGVDYGAIWDKVQAGAGSTGTPTISITGSAGEYPVWHIAAFPSSSAGPPLVTPDDMVHAHTIDNSSITTYATNLTVVDGAQTNNTATGTSHTFQIGVPVSVGDMISVAVSCDNAGASGAQSMTAPTDNKGHTYTASRAQNYDPGAASAGISQGIYRTVATQAMVATDTITLNASAASRMAATVTVLQAPAGYRPHYVTSGGTAGAATGTPTTTTGTLNTGDVVLGVISVESNAAVTADSDTTNGSWSTQHTAVSDSTVVGTSVRIASQTKLVTASGTQTYNPTLTSADCIVGYAIFRLAPILAPADLDHPHTIDETTVNTSISPVTPDDLVHGHTIDVAVVIPHPLVVPVDLAHDHTVDTTSISTGAVSIVPDDLSHAHVVKKSLVTTTPFGKAASGSGRYFVDQYGNPWFGQGDTAWAMSGGLSPTQVTTYLNNRLLKGFNFVLISAPEPYYTDNTPEYANYNGDLPFTGTSFQSPLNAAYWDHVEWMLDEAALRGITVLVCPQYLGYSDVDGWRETIAAAYTADPQNLTNYGNALMDRFQHKPNLMWLFGHDTELNATWANASVLIADRIRARSNHLVTGGGGPDYRGRASWSAYLTVDFDTVYIYDDTQLVSASKTSWDTVPAKPHGWFEGTYEYDTTGGTPSPATTLRQQQWVNFCSGGTYFLMGNAAVWQFDSGKYTTNVPGGDTWVDALDHPLAIECQVMGDFIRSIQWHTLNPDGTDTFLVSGEDPGATQAAARFSTLLGLVYVPSARSITVDTTEMNATDLVRLRWFDPHNGSYTTIASSEAQNANRVVTHPGNNSAGQPDWLLVVDLANTPVTPDDMVHTSTIDSATVIPHPVVVPNDMDHSSTIDEVVVIPHPRVISDDLVHGNTIDVALVTPHAVVIPSDLIHPSSIDDATISTGPALVVPVDLFHPSTIDAAVVIPHPLVVPVDLNHSNTIDPASVLPHSIVVPVDLAHSHTIDAGNVVPYVQVVPADLAHIHTIDTGVVVPHPLIVPADLAHTNMIDTATILTTDSPVTPTNLKHGHTIDTTNVVPHPLVAAADLVHTNTIDTGNVVAHPLVVPTDLVHAHTIDAGVVITFASVVIPDDLYHSSTIESTTITIRPPVVPDSLSHAHTIDEATVIPHPLVAPADLVHSSKINSTTVLTSGENIVEHRILQSTKNKLGVSETQTGFDEEILEFINQAFSKLHQLGIGPAAGFVIESTITTWEDYFTESEATGEVLTEPMKQMLRTYVYLMCRILFDPPSTSFVLKALEDQIIEHEWRLNASRELNKGTV